MAVNRWRGMKLRHKLILGFVLLGVVFWATAIAIIAVSGRYVEKVAGRHACYVAQEKMTHIDGFIQRRLETLQALALALYESEELINSNEAFAQYEDSQAEIQRRDSSYRDFTVASRELQQSLQNNELAQALQRIMTGPQGLFLEGLLTNRYGATIAQTGLISDYDQSDEHWWQEACNQGVSVGSIIYDSSVQSYALEIAVEVLDSQQERVGVLKGVIGIDQVVQHIVDDLAFEHGKGFKVLLLDNQGKVLHDQTGLFAFRDNLSHLQFFSKLNQKTGFFRDPKSYGRVSWFFAYARQTPNFSMFADLGWILLVAYDPIDLIGSGLWISHWVLGVLVFLTVLMVLIECYLSRSIFRRLGALKNAAHQIGECHWDIHIAMPEQDEIGQLSQIMQDMVDHLQITTASVDRLHQERRYRQQAMADLLASQTRLKETEKWASMGSWEYVLDTGELIFSEMIPHLLGHNLLHGPLSLDSVMRWVGPQTTRELRPQLQQVINEGTPYQACLQLTLPTGEQRWFSFMAMPVFNVEDQIIRLRGMIQDVTERMAVQQTQEC